MTLNEMISASGLKKGWIASKLGCSTSGLAGYTSYSVPLPIRYVKRLAELMQMPVNDVLQAAYAKWL
jgi:hypothetical protein